MPKMDPLVSICIPCHNAEAWVAKAVQSALEQDYRKIEVLVVDDGSSDRSLQELRQFGDRIRLFSTEQRGANNARNLLLKEARGEYLQFLDADDYLLPQKIERQLNDCSVAGDVIYSPVLCETWKDGQRIGIEPIPLNEALPPWDLLLAWQLPQTGGALWGRDFLVQLGGWDLTTMCDEHDLYLRAMVAEGTMAFSPAVGAVYRVWTEESRSRKDVRKIIYGIAEVLERTRCWMQDTGKWAQQSAAILGQTNFQLARRLAVDHPMEAQLFYKERLKAGLIHLEGPAAPIAYRICHKLLGFSRTEKIAQTIRTMRL